MAGAYDIVMSERRGVVEKIIQMMQSGKRGMILL